MSPVRASLDDGWLAEYVIEVLDELTTAMNQTNEPHFIQSSPITIRSNVNVYPLDNIAANFGKARYLYTENPGDSNFMRQPIELVGLEALTEFYQGGDTGSSIPVVLFSQGQTPRAAAVYYSLDSPGPGNFIEFAPVPGDNTWPNYRFIWEPMVVDREQDRRRLSLRSVRFISCSEDGVARFGSLQVERLDKAQNGRT